MSKNPHEFLLFVQYFAKYVYVVRHVIAGLIGLMFLGGVLISYSEGLPLEDSIYFSFITGLTIGYGDIHPESGWGKVLSIAVGIVGVLFTGVIVAVATRALADTAQHHLRQNS